MFFATDIRDEFGLNTCRGTGRYSFSLGQNEKKDVMGKDMLRFTLAFAAKNVHALSFPC